MTHNDWKFIKDGNIPDDTKLCWVLVYNKLDDYISVRIGIRNHEYCGDTWTECSDSPCFNCNDIILAWMYYDIPIAPEYPQLTGGEFAIGGIYGEY